MYALDVIEDYIPTKYTTNYTFFVLSILISFCIHLVIVLFITDSAYSCFGCKKISETKTKSLSIQLYKEPKFIPPVKMLEAVTEQNPPKPIIVETTPTLSKINKINYTILSSSIESVINEDSQKYQQAWQDSCDDTKSSSGNPGCPPTIERLGYKTADPYNLAKIFSRLSNRSSSKQQERIIAQLISKQDTMVAILKNDNLDEETRTIFSDELAYLRGEVQYQDCDGNLNSGNCAGEADLFKSASLIISLFETIVVD